MESIGGLIDILHSTFFYDVFEVPQNKTATWSSQEETTAVVPFKYDRKARNVPWHENSGYWKQVRTQIYM